VKRETSKPDPRILQQLRRADPALCPVLDCANGLPPLRRTPLLPALVSAILAQQLSVRAAATIEQRVRALLPRGSFTVPALDALSDEALRSAGVSRQKLGYLRAVSAYAAAGGLQTRTLARADDEEVITRLCEIKGVGRWTAEMLLIFAMGRPDVFPVDDLGIQLAVSARFGLRLKGRALRDRMDALSQAWRPHRSLVSRCLWAWRSAQTP